MSDVRVQSTWNCVERHVDVLHVVHTAAPLRLNEPEVHALQTVALAPEKDPAEHEMQAEDDDAPARFEYVPAVQALHAMVLIEYVPA